MKEDPAHVTFEYFLIPPTSPDFKQAAEPIARCYQWVYGTDDAWQEGKYCTTCSTPGNLVKWSLTDAPLRCLRCDGALTDFWPLDQVLADLQHELSLGDAVCVTARHYGELIGACWGYSATPEELRDHLNGSLPEDIRATPDLAATLRSNYPGVARFAYQDEIFVHPDWQRAGIGKQLFRRRHEAFLRSGLSVYVMRTKTNPPGKSYLWFTKWGYEVIGRYRDEDGRVLMAQLFDQIPSLT